MTADTMQNAKILEDKMPQEQNAIISAIYTIADVIVFIVAAIGYIIQDSFYLIFGYPEKDLLNKTALVTGGGSGIGRRLAQRLTDMGAKVVIWDINQAGIKETIQIVESMGGYCKGYVVDISDKNQVYKAAELVRREVGDIDILINNAGVVSGRLLLDTPDYLIERSFNVNVLAHFWTTKAFLPRMIERDEGHIVTIASMAGHVGICKLVDYCASKFAAVGFDEALRMELDVLGHQGVKTTCICPYFIQSTGMFDDVNARWISILDPNDVAERIIKAIKINEAIVIIPGYIKLLLSLRWLFPWGCASGLLKRLVPDAAPHQPPVVIPTIETITNIKSKAEIISTMTSEDDMPKSASLLVKRSPSHGERVL